MSIVYNSTKTADTINRAIDNSQGTTTTTQGAAHDGEIITEDLQPVVQCTGGYTNPVTIKTISGVPPVEFHAVEGNLKSWSIYGNTVEGVSVGEKIDITLDEPLNGISTYKDTLSLSTGKLTQKIKKLVLTGGESWQDYEGTNATRYNVSPIISDGAPMSTMMCSHFKYGGLTATDGNSGEITGTASDTVFRIYLWSDIDTIADWKTYLTTQYNNGTPVTIWYVLATPTETTVTVPTGMTGTIEGYTTQTGTPTPETPIYPTSNGTLQPDDSYLVYTAYNIPIKCGGITYNCYISDVLRKSTPALRKRKSKKAVNDTTVYDIMDSTGTVYRNVDTDGTPLETPVTETYTAPTITTIWGYNEFDVDTTVTPSNVTVQYYDN